LKIYSDVRSGLIGPSQSRTSKLSPSNHWALNSQLDWPNYVWWASNCERTSSPCTKIGGSLCATTAPKGPHFWTFHLLTFAYQSVLCVALNVLSKHDLVNTLAPVFPFKF